jgi:hypothetical protein
VVGAALSAPPHEKRTTAIERRSFFMVVTD